MTIHDSNSWRLSIHDHHDVTEEDVRAAEYGDDFDFWNDVHPVDGPKRSADWWRRYHASRKGFGDHD